MNYIITTVTTEDYEFLYTKYLLFSIRKHNTEVPIFVICPSYSDKFKKLCNNLNVEITTVQTPDFEDLNETRYGKPKSFLKAVWLKTQALRLNWDNIINIDADCIILKDLTPLIKIIQKYDMLCFLGGSVKVVQENEMTETAELTGMQYPVSGDIVNNGVFAMRRDIGEKFYPMWADLLEKYPTNWLAEQSIFSLLLEHLSLKTLFYNKLQSTPWTLMENAYIFHFCGKRNYNWKEYKKYHPTIQEIVDEADKYII